jgi:clan AA aspartic protease (TIGR02281 family)
MRFPKYLFVLFLPALLVWCAPDMASADIYRWIDKDGTTHYANSLDSVPAVYRSDVEIIAAFDPYDRRPSVAEEYIVDFIQAQNGIILVELSLNDGVRARMVLDTGASLVVISEDLARRLRLDSASDASRIKLQTAGGEIEGRDVVIDRVELGSAIRENVRAAVNYQPRVFKGFDGLLGASFLDAYRVTIDYQQRKIHLRRP